MKKYFFTLIILIGGMVISHAQSTEITPGSILPNVTTAQRTALASPKDGMLVFDNNTQSYWFRQIGAWVELPKAGSASNYWQLNGLGGNEIKNTNSGGFWSANSVDVKWNDSPPATAPVSGAGTRLMWIPSRSAFRAGSVDGTHWNADSIGVFSTAFGYNTKAKGKYSTALGYKTTASGNYSTAMGVGTTASGNSSTAMGYSTKASGDYSTAMGAVSTASGDQTTAMGSFVSTNGQKGSFIIGDYSISTVTKATEDDQFTARFNGGYRLFSKYDLSKGVSLASGGTAWSSISDSTKKDNFIKANGEEFLTKLKSLRLGSWNYKTTDTNPERYYGPMAQEIFSAYGKDPMGTIGSDTLVNTLNMDGLLFIFAQALEKRTESLKQENNDLKQTTASLKQENNAFQVEISSLQTEISSLKQGYEQRLAKLENLILVKEKVAVKE